MKRLLGIAIAAHMKCGDGWESALSLPDCDHRCQLISKFSGAGVMEAPSVQSNFSRIDASVWWDEVSF